MDTKTNIHGHDVLRLVAEASLTRGELDAELTRRYGAEALFCTCSATDMTRAELLGFLISRGKIKETAGHLEIERGKICKAGGGTELPNDE